MEILSKEKRGEIIDNIRNQVRKYVEDNNLKSLIIGVSGGLDSAVVAALCQEKYIGVPLYGMSIPFYSSNEHLERAEYIGRLYCSSFIIAKTFELDFKEFKFHFDYNHFGEDNYDKKITEGNLKARLRMMALYDVARKTKGAVLSTDNYSEYLAGFWTLHGDVGDIAPIQEIWKGLELWQIAEELGIRKDIIEAKPSDGLSITEDDTDEAQIGMDYKIFDTMMKAYLNDEIIDSPFFDIAVERYKNTEYKRRGAFNIKRESLNL